VLYNSTKCHAIYCANRVKIFSIIFHSPYAVKGYYLQELVLINVSWVKAKVSLPFLMTRLPSTELQFIILGVTGGKSANLLSLRVEQGEKKKSHLGCLLATTKLCTFWFAICQEEKVWTAIPYLRIIVMMFNSPLHDAVTIATNHSDLVKPKLLSNFKIFQ